MKHRVCELSSTAPDKLPGKIDDASGIGVHYIDEYIKPMNVTLDDDTKVTCKRRGLKISLSVGDKSGDGLMRRLDVSEDPEVMLQSALQEAASNAGVKLTVEDDVIFVEV